MMDGVSCQTWNLYTHPEAQVPKSTSAHAKKDATIRPDVSLAARIRSLAA